MDTARLRRRILVVTVTTRAAADSLPPGDGQDRLAVERGLRLLDGLSEEVDHDGNADSAELIDQAKRELKSLLDRLSA